jgi:hypothetical protein
LAIIHTIREKIRKQEYEFTIPHFFEEMANDNLTFADIEMAIYKGRVNPIRRLCLLTGKLTRGINPVFAQKGKLFSSPL